MKKLILICLLLSAVSGVFAQDAVKPSLPAGAHKLTAQEQKDCQQKVAIMCKNMKQELGLSNEQVHAIYAAENRYEHCAAMYAPKGMPAGLASNMTSERDHRIKSALKPEQLKKYEAMNANKEAASK